MRKEVFLIIIGLNKTQYTTFIMADCSGGMVTANIRARLVRPRSIMKNVNTCKCVPNLSRM